METIENQEKQESHIDYINELKNLRNELQKQKADTGSKKETERSYSKQKSIGAHPGVRNVSFKETDEKQKGYAGPFMLAFLTLLFETLFFLIGLALYR